MKDYHVYFPGDYTGAIWGCVTTGIGFSHVVPPCKPYPVLRHPLDHHFDWSQGRVFQHYQVLFIAQGRGVFESETPPSSLPVEGPAVMLLFPGIWHRYRPDPETGWVENWIECRGRVFDEARRTGLIDPHRPVLRAASATELARCFEQCHTLAQRGNISNQDMLSTLGIHMLSIIAHLQREERGLEKSIDRLVDRGHAQILLRCNEPLNIAGLAAELGVSYSHFRQAFKARLGISPKQYHVNLRLQKALDLLHNTDKSLKEIAEILSFESACHFSKQFKEHLGVSPNTWRTQHNTWHEAADGRRR